MRSISALVLYLAVAHFLLSCSASNTSAPSFWPQPASWSSGTGVISLAASFTITCGALEGSTRKFCLPSQFCLIWRSSFAPQARSRLIARPF